MGRSMSARWKETPHWTERCRHFLGTCVGRRAEKCYFGPLPHGTILLSSLGLAASAADSAQGDRLGALWDPQLSNGPSASASAGAPTCLRKQPVHRSLFGSLIPLLATVCTILCFCGGLHLMKYFSDLFGALERITFCLLLVICGYEQTICKWCSQRLAWDVWWRGGAYLEGAVERQLGVQEAKSETESQRALNS